MEKSNNKLGNKNRLISILKWNEYQISEHQSNNNRTSIEQQSNTYKNVKNDKNDKNIISEYEKNIGTLNGIVLEELESYTEDLTEEMIIEAIHIASRNNKRSWSYVKAILDRWTRNGYKQLADLKNDKKIVKVNFTDNNQDDLTQLYEN